MSTGKVVSPPAFDEGPTDITRLLKSLIDSKAWGTPFLVVTTDGVEPGSYEQFLEALRKFGIPLVETGSEVCLFDDFPGIDSTRRKTIAESLEES